MALSELHRKISDSLRSNFKHEMTDQSSIEIGYVLIDDYENEIEKARTRLPYFNAPEEYWMNQGKIEALKELIEKLKLTNE